MSLFLAVLAVSVSKDVVLAGTLPAPTNLGFHAALFLCGAAAPTSRRDLVQLLAAAAVLAVMLVYISMLFANLA
ncbi:twin-arginine translocation signal domain-containing protein [Phenylobacterium sp.]|uniref:twin-arginine translocation signal domain-containing protein n=1 Tax=Phenylobacterium sp. TaxID=1871053 RepID=UPI001215ACB9|nr:twin-arginine translocation signal domain-containing protein [Phenylobacterium sp.]THD55100.1 MAG: twin-arginine translocation signal domain-containing protein [Phenylobacterium sp.]